MAGVGSEAYIRFNVVGPVLYHQHIRGSHIGGGRWVVITPDYDIYEELLEIGPDILDIRFSPAGGPVPVGINPNTVYGFGPLAAAARQQLIVEAGIYAQEILHAQGGGAVAPALGLPAPAAAVPGGVFGQALVQRALGAGAPAPAAVPGAAVALGLVGQAMGQSNSHHAWIATETRGDATVGDVIDLTGITHQLIEDRGVAVVSGISIGIRRILKADLDSKGDGISSLDSDCRVMPLRRDGADKRYYDYKATIDKLSKSDLSDWPILGPKTVVWLLMYMFNNGGSPIAFHHRWLELVRLDYSASGTAEHLLLCKVIELMVTYDGIRVSHIAAAELIARKIQMVHERWKHKLPNFNGVAGQQGGASNMEDDTHLLLGTSDTRGNVGVCPELQSWLGEQLSKEALATKERRKAREERALMAEPSKKK